MKKLLLWKHWQVFLLTYGLIIVMYFVVLFFFVNTMARVSVTDDLSPTVFSGMLGTVGLMMVAMFIGIAIIYAWFWTVGTSLQSKLPEEVKLNVGFFKFAVLFPLIYMVIFFAFMGMSVANITAGGEPSPWMGLIIIPHLFTMFCMFYIFYFIAKSLKSVELGRMAHVGDYIGEFFLLWFFFIGVWLIQPKLNRWFSEDEGGVEQHLVG